MYKKILVPIDGSETAALGLKEAIALAAPLKSTLRILNVTNDFALMVEMSGAIDFEKVRQGLNEHGEKLLAEAKALAARSDVPAETTLLELHGGRVADCIVREAESSHCELIVLGTHGRRGFRRALLGSDAEGVVRASPVPVLLVRDPAGDAAA